MWPTAMDDHYETVPGLRQMPPYDKMSDEQFSLESQEPYTSQPQRVGWVGPPATLPKEVVIHRGNYGLEAPLWRMLDHRYDHFVGNCECTKNELLSLEDYFTVHFSCMHFVEKPGVYASEHAFMNDVLNNTHICTRRYLHKWLDAFTRAHGRLPPPLWEGSLEIPTHPDPEHEARVVTRQALILQNEKQEEDEAAANQEAAQIAAEAGGAQARLLAGRSAAATAAEQALQVHGSHMRAHEGRCGRRATRK